jgi:L-alanine-DL-glutamate epimerase-like enolase superfamily enzyme
MGLVHPKVQNVASPAEIYLGEYSDQLESIDADGCVSVPEGPGLGVEYNWDGIKKFKIAEINFD